MDVLNISGRLGCVRTSRAAYLCALVSAVARASNGLRPGLFLLLIYAGGFMAWCAGSAKAQDTRREVNDYLRDTTVTGHGEMPDANPPSPWFIMPTLVNTYPRLQSEDLINNLYNPAMRLVAPGFRDVRTVGSLRDEHLLWVPTLSIGRIVSPHLALHLQFGGGVGKVRTKRQDTSLLLLPLYTDFEIYRSALYLGLCADIFPWGMPEQREYRGLGERLKNTKPFIGLRVTETRAGYRAKVKNSLTPHLRFLTLEMSDTWQFTSFNANIGADIPVNTRNAFSVNVGYNVSSKRGYDFDGATVTFGWKHYFK